MTDLSHPKTSSRAVTTDSELKPIVGQSNIEVYRKSTREEAIKTRIVQAYSNFVIRVYCHIRFRIINSQFLETIEQHMPSQARILDIGCGFGLFANYFAMNDTSRAVYGADIDSSRILEAQQTAEKLGLTNVHFTVADAANYTFADKFDAVVMLDLLHHIDRSNANRLIEAVYHHLREGGVYLIKDVNVRPYWKMLFTFILDKLMDRERSVHYRDAKAWKALLYEVGFRDVKIYYINDYLPYPHVLLVCQK